MSIYSHIIRKGAYRAFPEISIHEISKVQFLKNILTFSVLTKICKSLPSRSSPMWIYQNFDFEFGQILIGGNGSIHKKYGRIF